MDKDKGDVKDDVKRDSHDVTISSRQDDVRCGYGNCTPDCLQCCAKPGMLLTTLCLLVLVEGNRINHKHYHLTLFIT